MFQAQVRARWSGWAKRAETAGSRLLEAALAPVVPEQVPARCTNGQASAWARTADWHKQTHYHDCAVRHNVHTPRRAAWYSFSNTMFALATTQAARPGKGQGYPAELRDTACSRQHMKGSYGWMT